MGIELRIELKRLFEEKVRFGKLKLTFPITVMMMSNPGQSRTLLITDN